jgi:hypothetical protein
MNTFQTTTVAVDTSHYRNYQGGFFKTLIAPEQTASYSVSKLFATGGWSLKM